MQIVAPAVKSSALWLGRLCVVVGDETGIVVTVSPSDGQLEGTYSWEELCVY